MYPANQSQTTLFDPRVEHSNEFSEYRLFTPNAVYGAALLGGPIGGALVMGINYKRMGNSSSAMWTIIAGFVIMALSMPIGYFVPGWAQLPCALLLAYAMKQAAQSQQGQAVSEHIEKTGMKASGWAAFGIGLIGMVIACALIAIYVLAVMAITHQF